MVVDKTGKVEAAPLARFKKWLFPGFFVLLAGLILLGTLLTGYFSGSRPAQAADSPQFTEGNVVVYRVGTGNVNESLLNTGNPVFLDEYTPAGTLVQSIALPTTVSGSNYPLIASGTASSEGLLTRSADGKYLILTGYGTTTGGSSLSGTSGATVPRVVGRVDSSGSIDTTTALTDFSSGNNPRSAFSTDGTKIWVAGGAGGVRYTTLGSNSSTDLTSATFANVRSLGIFGGQLFASSGSGTNTFKGVNTVGTGLPTSGSQTVTRLPGLTDTTDPSTYSFYLADLSAAVAGVDTLYIADDSTGVITKFSLVSDSWVSNGKVGTASDSYRGLTGVTSGSTVTLYATRKGGTGPTGGGELVKLIDSSGYNGSFSITPTLLASSGTSKAFRGVAMAPVSSGPSITTQPSSQSITSGNTASLSVVADGGTSPLSYQWFKGSWGDISNPVGTNSASYTTEALTSTTNYWVMITDADNRAAFSNAAAITVNQPDLSITTQPASQSITAGNTTTLSVGAGGGTPPLYYAWYQGTAPDTTNPISSNTGNSLTTPILTQTTSYWVKVSDSGSKSVNSNTATITVSPQIRIHDIQGKAHISPFVTTVKDNSTSYGSAVTDVPGIVTGIASNGFYFQDPNPDNDPATSEGLFVYTGTNGSKPSVGDSVTVSGAVAEFRNGCTGASCNSSSSAWSNLTTTELSANASAGVSLTWTLVSSGNTLPSPTIIGNGGRVPPNAVIEDDTSGSIETTPNSFDPDTDGIDFYESLEGMRVQVNSAVVVGPTALFGSASPALCTTSGNNCELYIAADNGSGAVSRTARGGVKISATNFNPERIILNNILNSSVPSAMPDASVGDKFSGPITGILDYNYANFKLLPSEALPALTSGNLQKETLTFQSRLSTQLDVATFNVENLAPTDPDSKFQALAVNVVTNLKSPDIITVEEIQDNNGTTDNGTVAADQTYAKLIAAISTAGGPAYSYRQIDPVNDQDGGATGGNIRQGFLFRTDRGLAFVDRAGASSTIANAVLNNGGVPQLQYSPGRIDPSNSAWSSSRKPLAAEFTFNGRTLFVIANHFNSKGGDQPLFGRFQPPALSSETQRIAQATAEKNFVSQILAINPDADIIVAGDLNDFEFSNPITILKSAGLNDLVENLAANERYTYDYQGNSEVLDHIMVSNHLLNKAGAIYDIVHINAEFPDNARTSDHDPGLARFTIFNTPQAVNDSYDASTGQALTKDGNNGILANDSNGPSTVITHSNPVNGTLKLDNDGSFTYTSIDGYTGPDTFSYTSSNAVQLYSTDLPPLGTFNGVNVTGGGYGSSLYPVPGSSDEFYGLTDRGPNVDGPNGSKIEPLPDFVPSIGKFKFENGQAILEETITLKAADGSPYNGRVNTQANTGETIYDLNGNVLPPSPNGYDSEGLVALPDGTFWVSDEYGPYITHFDSTGKQIGRLSPFDGTLPAELQFRLANRGMEGLTITPDGSTLVGVMQSALQQTDLSGYDCKKLTVVRIVTYKLANGELHEYLYLLDNPGTTKTAVSEITALSNTTFLVDERDGNFPPNSYKKLWLINLNGATDIGPTNTVANTRYAAEKGGLIVGDKTLELLVKGKDTAASTTALAAAGITPVSKSLYLDIDALLRSLDPQARFFSHDKLEGVAVIDGGSRIVISNDSDFGISGVDSSTTPYTLLAKNSPVTGEQDDGEFLVVDLAKLPAVTTSATVTLNVQKATATTTLSNLTQTYDGQPKYATATTNPLNLPVTIAYAQGGSPVVSPINSGNYDVTATISATNFISTPVTGTLTINKAPATITISNQNQIYDGTSKVVSTTTQPANLKVNVTYKQGGNTVANPTATGSYDVTATIDEANYTGTQTGTLVIDKAGTTTVLISSQNPSQTGKPVTFNALVETTPKITDKPAGTVSFYIDNVFKAQVALDATGNASFTSYFSNTKTYAIKAKYEGAANFQSSDDTLTQSVSTFVTDFKLAVQEVKAGYGSTINLVATYTNKGKPVANKVIDFYLDGHPVCGAGTLPVCPVTGTNGKATLPNIQLPMTLYPGTYSNGLWAIVDSTDISSSASLIISKATAGVTLGNLIQTYDGNPKFATATTNPDGLKVVVSYKQGFTSITSPINAGAYSVTATLDDPRYTGKATGTLVISKATVKIVLDNLKQTYDGSPKYATVTTVPAGLRVLTIYSQKGFPIFRPVNPGSYDVTVRVDEANYTGSATGVLVIQPGTPTVTTGTVINLRATTATLTGNVNANFAFNRGTYFEWGLVGDSVVNKTPVSFPVSGNISIPVSGNLRGLQPNRDYYYRLVVVYGAEGSIASGNVVKFKTPAR